MSTLRLTSIALFILLSIAVVYSMYLFSILKETIGIVIPVLMIGVCFIMAIPPLISFFASGSWSIPAIKTMTIINVIEMSIILVIGFWLIATSVFKNSDYSAQSDVNQFILDNYGTSATTQMVSKEAIELYGPAPFIVICNETNTKCFSLAVLAEDTPGYEDFGEMVTMKLTASNDSQKAGIRYKAIGAGYAVRHSFVNKRYDEFSEFIANDEAAAKLKVINYETLALL